jgi:UDP-glucose 4-epimerase
MLILVTGVAGFIGSTLSEKLLSLGYKVIGVDNFYSGTFNNIRSLMNNESFTFIEMDITEYQKIKEIAEKCDYIFHLAAQIHVERSILRPCETMDINIKSTQNLLEICKYNKNIGMTFASSAEVYGDGEHTEKSSLNPKSPYASSKVAAESLCIAYYHSYGVNVRVIRNFNTYGPKQVSTGYGSVIAIFIRRALANEPLLIYGDGKQTRDYQYITDAVDGYIKSMNFDKGTIVNTGYGKDQTILEIAQTIIEITKSNSIITHIPARNGEVRKLKADMTYAKSLGIEPLVPFSVGISNFIKWMSDNGNCDIMN